MFCEKIKQGVMAVAILLVGGLFSACGGGGGGSAAGAHEWTTVVDAEKLMAGKAIIIVQEPGTYGMHKLQIAYDTERGTGLVVWTGDGMTLPYAATFSSLTKTEAGLQMTITFDDYLEGELEASCPNEADFRMIMHLKTPLHLTSQDVPEENDFSNGVSVTVLFNNNGTLKALAGSVRPASPKWFDDYGEYIGPDDWGTSWPNGAVTWAQKCMEGTFNVQSLKD